MTVETFIGIFACACIFVMFLCCLCILVGFILGILRMYKELRSKDDRGRDHC